jgi:hypothetical protein
MGANADPAEAVLEIEHIEGEAVHAHAGERRDWPTTPVSNMPPTTMVLHLRSQ